MKQTIRSFIFHFLLCWLVPAFSFASHISGGDISYQCLGGNQYKITLNLFRDCSGVDMSSSEFITVESTCGNQSLTANLVNPGGTEISQLCPEETPNSTCHDGTLPGMQRYTYEVTTTMPPCSDWVISWTTCCRNTTVNVSGSDLENSYIESTLNSNIDSCNNSPVFTAQPIPYVCANQEVIYNWGITEVDGDSMTYQLIGARATATTPLFYNFPYSASNAINGIVIDPFTGQLTFTPVTIGNFIVVVQVNEYNSSGLLIGTSMRDIQFVVQSCSNLPPPAEQGQITGLSGTANQTGDYALELCDGGSFSFSITISDSDLQDTISLTSNIGDVLPGSTFSVTGYNPVTATISWTASGGSTFFNYFTVFANDGACPIAGIQSYVYQVSVIPGTVGGPDTTILCGIQSAQLTATGGNNFVWSVISGDPMVIGTNFSCDSCANPVAKPTVSTYYEVVSDLVSNNCQNRDTVQVKVVPEFFYSLSQNDSAICLGDSVQFTATPDNTSASYLYNWTPSIFSNDSVSVSTGTFTNSGVRTVYVKMTSLEGCVKTDSMQVLVSSGQKPIISILSDNTICAGDSILLNPVNGCPIPSSCGLSASVCPTIPTEMTVGEEMNNLGSISYPAPYGNWYESSKHQILFLASELQAMGFQGGQISSIALNVASINGTIEYKNFEIKIGCTSASSLDTWQTGLFTVFPAQTINIATGWNIHVFDNSFDWDGQSNLIIETCFNNNTSNTTTDWSNNSPTYYTSTSFNSVIYYNEDNDDQVCTTQAAPTQSTDRPNIKFSIRAGLPMTTYGFIWSPGAGLSDSTASHPWASTDTTYTVIVYDTIGGCADTASFTTNIVPNFSYTKTQTDSAICLNESVQFSVTADASSSSYTYSWLPESIIDSPSDSAVTGTFDQPGLITIFVEISTPFGCEKRDSMQVLVSSGQQPMITIVADTLICSGDSVQLVPLNGCVIPPACGLSATPCPVTPTEVSIGNGNGNDGSISYPAPYGNWYEGSKHQLLFRASELQAMGFQGGQISAIALNIAVINGTTTYNNFEIKIGCTSDSVLSTWQNGLFTVFPAQTITIAAGWNTHTFTNSFDWDGISNIVIETCFNNNTGNSNDDWTNNSPTFYSVTSFLSVIYDNADNDDMLCSSPSAPTPSSNRPNVKFTVRAGQSTSTFAYSWTPATDLSDSISSSPWATPNQSTTIYTVVVMDTIGGCADTASVTIHSNLPFNYQKLQSEDTICLNETVQFTVTPDSGQLYTYQWIPSVFLNADNIANPLAGPVSTPGNYTYKFTISNGCEKTDSMKITVSQGDVPTITIAGEDSICVGSTAQLTATSTGGNAPTYSFDWSNGASLSDSTIFNPLSSPSASTTYTLIVMDTIGHCSDTAIFMLAVLPYPDAQISLPDDSLCLNDNFIMLTSSPSGGTWSGNGMAGNGIFSPLNAGTGTHEIVYSVQVPSAPAFGCPDKDTVNIIVFPNPPVPMAYTANPYCASSVIDSLTALSSGGMITWYADSLLTDTFFTGSTILNAIAGTTSFDLWVTETSDAGCVSNGSYKLTIVVIPNPIASFTATPPQGFSPLTVSFNNASYPDTNIFMWNFGGQGTSMDMNPSFIFTKPGNYEVVLIATDSNGCADTSKVTVIVEDDTKLIIPNIFTPNNDGKNDAFKVQYAALSEYHVVIFNRWGTKVYESSDPAEEWNGKDLQGQDANDGTYFYVITAKDRNGNLITRDDVKGAVTLLRE